MSIMRYLISKIRILLGKKLLNAYLMKFDHCIKSSFLFQVIITFLLVGTLIFPWLQISIDTLPSLGKYQKIILELFHFLNLQPTAPPSELSHCYLFIKNLLWFYICMLYFF